MRFLEYVAYIHAQRDSWYFNGSVLQISGVHLNREKKVRSGRGEEFLRWRTFPETRISHDPSPSSSIHHSTTPNRIPRCLNSPVGQLCLAIGCPVGIGTLILPLFVDMDFGFPLVFGFMAPFLDTGSGAGEGEGEEADDDMTVNLREIIVHRIPVRIAGGKKIVAELDSNHDAARVRL
ncbi:hypothetical protein EV421DRAFT_555453 [Armillaria borealis]|uniref:Uncharacterized protein n=1 Tax=Armillaria borealis TaxID=47425 RepID=A0AA39JHK7_9AGAR|nr:hypothetical protein EV421DRAFT_555453 [Armillaria borealis]